MSSLVFSKAVGIHHILCRHTCAHKLVHTGKKPIVGPCPCILTQEVKKQAFPFPFFASLCERSPAKDHHPCPHLLKSALRSRDAQPPSALAALGHTPVLTLQDAPGSSPAQGGLSSFCCSPSTKTSDPQTTCLQTHRADSLLRSHSKVPQSNDTKTHGHQPHPPGCCGYTPCKSLRATETRKCLPQSHSTIQRIRP